MWVRIVLRWCVSFNNLVWHAIYALPPPVGVARQTMRIEVPLSTPLPSSIGISQRDIRPAPRLIGPPLGVGGEVDARAVKRETPFSARRLEEERGTQTQCKIVNNSQINLLYCAPLKGRAKVTRRVRTVNERTQQVLASYWLGRCELDDFLYTRHTSPP